MPEYLKLVLELPIAIIFIFYFLRLFGKKELQQSTPMEFAFMVLLLSIAWDILLEPTYSIPHMLLLMATLAIVIYLIDWLTYRFPKIEKLFLGEAKTLIKDGELDPQIIQKERMSEEELDAKLRTKGVFDRKEVELAILEVSGELSVKKKEKK